MDETPLSPGNFHRDARKPWPPAESLEMMHQLANRDLEQFGGFVGDIPVQQMGQPDLGRGLWAVIVGQRKNEAGQITPFYYFQQVVDAYTAVTVNNNPDQTAAPTMINVPLPAAINPDPTNPFYGQQFNGGAYGLCYEITGSTAVTVGSIQRLSPGYGQIAVTDPQDPVFGQNGTWIFKDSQVKLFVVVYESYDWLACLEYTPPTPIPLIGWFPGEGFYKQAIPGSNTVSLSRQDLDAALLIAQLVYVAKPYSLQQSFSTSNQTQGTIIGIGSPGIDSQGALVLSPLGNLGPGGPPNRRFVYMLKSGYEVYLQGAFPVGGGSLTQNTPYLYLVTLCVGFNSGGVGIEQACSGPLSASTTSTNQAIQLSFTAQVAWPGYIVLQGQSVNIYRASPTGASNDPGAPYNYGPFQLIGSVNSPSGTFVDTGLAGGATIQCFQDWGTYPTGSGTLFQQVLTPSYKPGDIIAATRLDQPFLAALVSEDSYESYPYFLGFHNVPPTLIQFQDLNWDGRSWVNEPAVTDFGQIPQYGLTGGFASQKADNVFPGGKLNVIPNILYAVPITGITAQPVGPIIPIVSSQSPQTSGRSWSGATLWYNNDGSLGGGNVFGGLLGLTLIAEYSALDPANGLPNFGVYTSLSGVTGLPSLIASGATITSAYGKPVIIGGGGVQIFASFNDLAAAYPSLVAPPGPLTFAGGSFNGGIYAVAVGSSPGLYAAKYTQGRLVSLTSLGVNTYNGTFQTGDGKTAIVVGGLILSVT
jgi:hypothetical protein